MTSVSWPGSLVVRTEPVEQRLAGVHETGQHDEQVAGDEGGDQRVAATREGCPGRGSA